MIVPPPGPPKKEGRNTLQVGSDWELQICHEVSPVVMGLCGNWLRVWARFLARISTADFSADRKHLIRMWSSAPPFCCVSCRSPSNMPSTSHSDKPSTIWPNGGLATGSLCIHSCPRVRDPLSRYTCRSGFPQNPGFFRSSSLSRMSPFNCQAPGGVARQAASEKK